MARKASATPVAYSPSPTIQKGKSNIYKDGDLDWVLPDYWGFQQCRPAFPGIHVGRPSSCYGSSRVGLRGPLKLETARCSDPPSDVMCICL
ncbi:hypothetical protein CRG98_014730 [Punica granatum]|uniref:Uncharacterized protein n=1 Tax=Punica granatum TaxID=22663 RepID=A0A2I0K8L4_PUNGR|nr:hypothetical protein CRG98_014730 [Punica granatum]